MRSRKKVSGSRKKQQLNHVGVSPYEKLEPRNLLAAYFPTYVNGEFTLGNGPGAPTPYALSDTFALASKPDSTKTIYLDFDGFHSVNNAWNHDIVFPAFDRDGDSSTFSDAELIEIQLQFQNVAEDFLPFDINVTTIEPDIEKLRKTSVDDQEFGIRSVNTQATGGFGGFGGIAFLNSFNDNIDNPVFALNKGENNGGMTNSHEIGHSLGLLHDGLGSATYHPGTGSGQTGWGPLMGAPFGKNVTQWSIGDYANSTNTEDDFEIITKDANEVDYIVDDHGNDQENASKIDAVDDNVFDYGAISQNTDVDFFKFRKGNGNVSFSVNSFDLRPNLDVLARIYDADGNIVGEENPVDGTNAFFDLALPAGEYTVSVEGIGKAGVYSDYGSVGFYTIEGVIDNLITELPIGEVGRITDLNDKWQTIELTETYTDPVIIASPVSFNGGDPSLTRIRNVTPTSFEIRLQEWDYRDGRHTLETVDYLVVNAGEYVLDDGTILFAKNESSQTQRWKTYGLGDTFRDSKQDPIVFAQVVSNNDPSAVTPRIRKVTSTDFQIKVQEEQANVRTPHGAETVSWLAIQQNVSDIGDLSYETGTTPNAVTHRNYNIDFSRDFASRPAFFAKMQSFNGGDPAAIRAKSIDADGATIILQEERSFDYEVRHNPEVVGFWAIETGLITGQPKESPLAFQASTYNQGLWDALELQRSWGETSIPFANYLEQGGRQFNVPGSSSLDSALNNYLPMPTQGLLNGMASNFHASMHGVQNQLQSILSGAIDSHVDLDSATDNLFATVHENVDQMFDDVEIDFGFWA